MHVCAVRDSVCDSVCACAMRETCMCMTTMCMYICMTMCLCVDRLIERERHVVD